MKQVLTPLLSLLVTALFFVTSCKKDDGNDPDGDGENNEVNFFTDKRDDQTYKTVTIGEQTWMAENLNYNISDSFCYEEEDDSCDKYGRLYNFTAANEACPPGWHLPSDDEWKKLEIFLGMDPEVADQFNYRGTNEGAKLKKGGSSGFDAVYGGQGQGTLYNGAGDIGVYWTSDESETNEETAYSRWVRVGQDKVNRGSILKSYFNSCRCVKD